MSAPVEVTQADRDAAAPFAFTFGDVATAQLQYDIQAGHRDDHHLVQAFARHRIAAQAEAMKHADALAEALGALQEDLRVRAELFPEGHKVVWASYDVWSRSINAHAAYKAWEEAP